LYDGAACLLTLHFLDSSERLRTLKEIRRRLKPDARLVVAHHSVPSGRAERWMTRSAAFADRAGIDWEKARASAARMAVLPLLSVAQEEGWVFGCRTLLCRLLVSRLGRDRPRAVSTAGHAQRRMVGAMRLESITVSFPSWTLLCHCDGHVVMPIFGH
jgi:SAM-dependent methyltransferase